MLKFLSSWLQWGTISSTEAIVEDSIVYNKISKETSSLSEKALSSKKELKKHLWMKAKF